MDTRTDPVEIIARVSERDGRQRAFAVWMYKATRAGWTVTVASTRVDQPGPECGVVEIEGLRYRILHAERVRQRVAIVPAGEHLIAASVRLSTGDSEGVSWAWKFAHAAWAEPIVS